MKRAFQSFLPTIQFIKKKVGSRYNNAFQSLDLCFIEWKKEMKIDSTVKMTLRISSNLPKKVKIWKMITLRNWQHNLVG